MLSFIKLKSPLQSNMVGINCIYGLTCPYITICCTSSFASCLCLEFIIPYRIIKLSTTHFIYLSDSLACYATETSLK